MIFRKQYPRKQFKIWDFLFPPLAVGGVLSAGLLVAFLAGFRLNTTSSMPFGVYRQVPVSQLERGMIATFCLEDAEFMRLAKERGYLGWGFCDGIKPLGKEIFGLPGDEISLQNELISVNGNPIPLTETKKIDSHGRTMPASKLTPGVIPEGYALMLSPHHSGGFDSRYFGLVRIANLHPIRPVFTW